LPIVKHLIPTNPQAVDKIRTGEPGGRGRPDPLGETTFEEDVTRRLGGASTQLAGRLMWPSAFCKAIRGPEAILDGKPGEETTLWGCPSLPDNVAELTWQRGEELDFVGRAGRVASIRGQGPGYGVLRVWEELDIREKIPKADVLLHMFNSEIIDRDVRDPVMVMESISNCPILSPGGLENQGARSFGGAP
jgi:hypothetical protein